MVESTQLILTAKHRWSGLLTYVAGVVRPGGTNRWRGISTRTHTHTLSVIFYNILSVISAPPSELISSDKAQGIDSNRLWLGVYIEFRSIEYFFITRLSIGSVTMFLSELNKSEVIFGFSRKLSERYIDIYLF